MFAEKIVGWLGWERVAMLPEHAKGLPKITKYDKRYKPKRAYKSVEVEAMGESVVLGMVRDRLNALLPESARCRTCTRDQATSLRAEGLALIAILITALVVLLLVVAVQTGLWPLAVFLGFCLNYGIYLGITEREATEQAGAARSPFLDSTRLPNRVPIDFGRYG